MKFLNHLLHRLFNRSMTPPAVPPAPEPLPDDWLTDPHFDVSRLNLEQLNQKEAHHLAVIDRMEAEN